MTFPTPHIGHSRHGLFFTRWIVNPMLTLLKRTMTYPEFEPGTFGLAVSIANHLGRYVAPFKIGSFHETAPTTCIASYIRARSHIG
jgi:hypothetical protein